MVSVIPKITFAKLCQPIHEVLIIPVSSDLFNLENVGKGGRGITKKIEYPKNEKSYLDEINSFFW